MIAGINICAAGNGVISFIKSLAQNAGKNNVQCNTAALGLVNSGPLNFHKETLIKIAEPYPSKRIGNIEDVTGIISFLLSNQADPDYRPSDIGKRRP